MPSASYPQPDPAQAAEAPNHMALRLAGVTPRRRGRSCRERPRGLLRGLSDDGLQRDGSGRGGGWRLASIFGAVIELRLWLARVCLRFRDRWLCGGLLALVGRRLWSRVSVAVCSCAAFVRPTRGLPG